MKRFLSVLLAVVMVVAMLPAGIAFAADGDNTDIVFDFTAAVKAAENDGVAFVGSGYTDAFSANAELVGYMPEGIAVSAKTLGLKTSSIRWHKGAGIRMCNHYADWTSKTGVGRESKFLFDITISADQAGWYRPSIKLHSSTPATNVFANYMMSGTEIKYLGDVAQVEGKNDNQLNPVYLAEGTHTLVMACYRPDSGQPTSYIGSITLHAVNETPVVDADSVEAPATVAIGETGTVDASAITLSDEAATFALATYGMNENAVSTGASEVDYIEVKSSNEYVATVAKATATTSTITPKHEGTTTLTITPVVGGVAQTAMATTKTLTVTDSTNIKFDFDDFSTLFVSTGEATATKPFAKHSAITSTPLLSNFSVDTANGVAPIWQPSGGGVRFRAYHAKWNKTDNTNDKAVLNIEVAEGKAGWYSPFVSISGNDEAVSTNPAYLSAYMIAPSGKVSFLGDARGQVTLNPVYLEAGTNKIVFAGISGNTLSAYIYKLYFNKLDAAPTYSAPAVEGIPETIAIGEKASATVAITANEKAYQLEEVGMTNAANYYKKAERDTYIKVTSSVDGIVNVTSPAVSGSGNKKVASFSVTGLKAGTTVLTFTPVIAGVEKTELATTKTVKVQSWDLNYDMELTFKNEVSAEDYESGRTDMTKPFSAVPELKNLMPEGLSLSKYNVSDTLMRWNNQALRFCNHGQLWTSNGNNSVLAFDIAISADQAGWYRTNVQTPSGFTNAQKFYTYMILADGTVKYLGDLTANGKRLNPVYLAEGTHSLYLGCYSASSVPTTYIQEINLYRYENAPTMTTFTADIPSALALNGGEKLINFESATLSDTGNFEYGLYTVNANGECRFDLSSTSDYMLVESSDPSVATVARRGQNSWKITPVSDGTTTITVTPYYNGVAYDNLKQTKTVTVTYPNESVNYAPNFIVNAVVGDEGTNAEAAALITTNGLAVGEIGAAELGSTVTLTAEDSDAYKFLYWYNGNSKKILSDNKTYNFTVGTKAAIYAKYARVDGELTEYATAAGQLTTEDKITVDEKNSRAVGNYYKLYVDATEGSYESTLVEKTAASDAFVCWMKGDKVVSYNSAYSFYTWPGAETAVEVTEGEKSDVPAVVLFENNGAYMLELVNFEGKTIIEKGILFAGSGVPTVNNFGAKAVAADKDAAQFTASSDASIARAYVIYRDGASYRVAYSD